MSNDSGSSHSLLAFLVGAAAGAILALLYAPHTGKETRDIVGEKVREGKERGRELGARAKVKARAAMDDAAGYLDRQRGNLQSRRERFSAAVDAGREAYREEKDRS
jgi:gas vesicle protein